MDKNTKSEVERILRLVQEGKIDAKDALDLIETLEAEDTASGPDQTAAEEEVKETAGSTAGKGQTESSGKDFFGKVFEALEGASKDVATAIQWDDVKRQVKENVEKGVATIKSATEEARKGNSPFSSVFGAQSDTSFDLPLAVPEGKTLRMEVPSGDIKVKVTGFPGTIKGKATFRAYAEEDAKEKAKAYTPIIEESDKSIVFRVPDTNDVSVDLEVDLMDGCPIEIMSKSGSISISGTEQSCRIEGHHGSIELKEVAGIINVTAIAGDVQISDSECDQITVQSKSGSISLKRVDAVANLRTTSGDIELRSLGSHAASLETTSGQIVAKFEEPFDAALNARTVAGNISISVPENSDCRINISTLSGSVATRLDLEDMRQERLNITGKLGKGNGTIDASAVQGDIELIAIPEAEA